MYLLIKTFSHDSCLLAQAPFTAGFNLQPVLKAELVELSNFCLRSEGLYGSFFCIDNSLHHHFLVVSAMRIPQGKIVISMSVLELSVRKQRLRNGENIPEIQKTFFTKRFSSVFYWSCVHLNATKDLNKIAIIYRSCLSSVS